MNGYPVGEPWSFSERAAHSLGHDCVRIAPVTLRNPSALFDYLAKNPGPDALVLQFGNYETPLPLLKQFRAVVAARQGWMANRIGVSSSSSSKGAMLPPEQVFEASLAWKMRVVLKQQYAGVAQRLTPQLFDPDSVRHSLRSLLGRLAPYQIPLTVVLSPLPCADHMARRFRIESAQIFQQEAEATGALSLNTAQVLGYSDARSKRPFDIYADERHLNATGHRMLADALVATLTAASGNDGTRAARGQVRSMVAMHATSRP